MYQFIMKNSSGEGLGGIGGHMFADTAYLRYLGTKKVIMSNVHSLITFTILLSCGFTLSISK